MQDSAFPAFSIRAVLALYFTAIFYSPDAELTGRTFALGRVYAEVEAFSAPFVRVLGFLGSKDYVFVKVLVEFGLVREGDHVVGVVILFGVC